MKLHNSLLLLLAAAEHSNGFVAPQHHLQQRHAITTMRAEGTAPLAKAFAALLAGAAISSAAEMASADGSTVKFSLPPVITAQKDRYPDL